MCYKDKSQRLQLHKLGVPKRERLSPAKGGHGSDYPTSQREKLKLWELNDCDPGQGLSTSVESSV